jgi:hypothetical protein
MEVLRQIEVALSQEAVCASTAQSDAAAREQRWRARNFFCNAKLRPSSAFVNHKHENNKSNKLQTPPPPPPPTPPSPWSFGAGAEGHQGARLSSESNTSVNTEGNTALAFAYTHTRTHVDSTAITSPCIPCARDRDWTSVAYTRDPALAGLQQSLQQEQKEHAVGGLIGPRQLRPLMGDLRNMDSPVPPDAAWRWLQRNKWTQSSQEAGKEMVLVGDMHAQWSASHHANWAVALGFEPGRSDLLQAFDNQLYDL